MNVKQQVQQISLAAAMLILASSALATNHNHAGDSGKTRAQVIAEMDQARAQGLMNVPRNQYPKILSAPSSKTRAEVVAELEQAYAQGLMNVPRNQYPRTPTLNNSSTQTRQPMYPHAYNPRSGVMNDIYSGA